MRALRLVPVLLLVAGAGLVVAAVASGTADVALLLVFPVVTGSSALFLLGVLLLVLGLVALPFAWAVGPGPEREPSPATARPSEPTSGAVVLIGPFPFFFGAFRSVPRWARWAISLTGAAVVFLLVLAVLLFG